MPDLTTYTDHPRTIPTLTAFNARREAARLAREDQKRARLAHFRRLEQAAQESLTRPTKTPRERKRPTGTETSRPARHTPTLAEQIHPCAGPCKRATRPRDIPLADAPNTVPRVRAGKCSTCANDRKPRPVPVPVIVPCRVCGHPTRVKKAPEHRAPGTRVRDRQGRCSECHETRPMKPASTPRKTARDTKDVPAMAREYLAGDTIGIIADRHGLGKTTVRTLLVNHGVTIRPKAALLAGRRKTYPAELVEAVRHHYVDQRKSKADTADAVGVSVDTVDTVMKRHALPARSVREARWGR